jgi:CsoR family transcriptional regulator, copper-sensing transcriptional repressor
MRVNRKQDDFQYKYHHNNTYDIDYEHTHSTLYPIGTHSHTHQNTQAVLNRLSKAIGHLRAVHRMVEEGRDCSEILIQLAAVRSAVNGLCKIILKDHIDHCIVDAIKFEDMETVDELMKAIETMIK